MRIFVKFDNTCLDMMLGCGYKYFVYVGSEGKATIYPFKNLDLADEFYYCIDDLRFTKYIGQEGEPLRKLADGTNLNIKCNVGRVEKFSKNY